MKTTTQQNIVAISSTAKQYIVDQAASYSAPSKSKEDLGASQREIVDAMHNFIEKHRYAIVEGGEELDMFEAEVHAVLALRGETVRANTLKSIVANQEQELAALRAKLAALGA
jgi:hypothetical protein